MGLEIYLNLNLNLLRIVSCKLHAVESTIVLLVMRIVTEKNQLGTIFNSRTLNMCRENFCTNLPPLSKKKVNEHLARVD